MKRQKCHHWHVHIWLAWHHCQHEDLGHSSPSPWPSLEASEREIISFFHLYRYRHRNCTLGSSGHEENGSPSLVSSLPWRAIECDATSFSFEVWERGYVLPLKTKMPTIRFKYTGSCGHTEKIMNIFVNLSYWQDLLSAVMYCRLDVRHVNVSAGRLFVMLSAVESMCSIIQHVFLWPSKDVTQKPQLVYPLDQSCRFPYFGVTVHSIWLSNVKPVLHLWRHVTTNWSQTNQVELKRMLNCRVVRYLVRCKLLYVV